MRGLVAVFCLVFCAELAGAAPFWNVTEGVVDYHGDGGLGSYSARIQIEPDIISGSGELIEWTRRFPILWGVGDESIWVRLDPDGAVYLAWVTCMNSSEIGTHVTGYLIPDTYSHLLVPASPSVGDTWEWQTPDWAEFESASFRVAASERVLTGRGNVETFRIDVNVSANAVFSSRYCTEWLLPHGTTSFWVAEHFGIVKWNTATETHLLMSADAIVDRARGTMSRIKAMYID